MSSGLRKLRLFRCAAATIPIDRASVRGECAEKTPRQVHFLSRSFSLSEAVAQNPPGECSHCRYLSIASGSNAVHNMGHPIRRSTSETVGHKSCRISI